MLSNPNPKLAVALRQNRATPNCLRLVALAEHFSLPVPHPPLASNSKIDMLREDSPLRNMSLQANHRSTDTRYGLASFITCSCRWSAREQAQLICDVLKAAADI